LQGLLTQAACFLLNTDRLALFRYDDLGGSDSETESGMAIPDDMIGILPDGVSIAAVAMRPT
jgi:hypothetical protein